MFSWLQKHQPIQITGAIAHSLIWASGRGKPISSNPNFEPHPMIEDGIAVYCIHGTADYPTSFERIATRLLELDSFPPIISKIHLVSFDKRFKGLGIDEFANQLLDIIQKNKHKHVILLGHSRGGLIAAWFTEFLAAEAGIEVLGVIPICSPFGGSYWAQLPLKRWSRSIGQMELKSEFLKSLEDKMIRSNHQYFPIAAANDSLVSMDSTCIPAHLERRKTFDRHGHLSIMSSQRVVDYIGTCIHNLCTDQLAHTQIEIPQCI